MWAEAWPIAPLRVTSVWARLLRAPRGPGPWSSSWSKPSTRTGSARQLPPGGTRRVGHIQDAGLGSKSKGGALEVRPHSITALLVLTSPGWSDGSGACFGPHLVTANLNTAHSDFSPQELLPHRPMDGINPFLICSLPSFQLRLLHAELLAGLGPLHCDPTQCLWFPHLSLSLSGRIDKALGSAPNPFTFQSLRRPAFLGQTTRNCCYLTRMCIWPTKTGFQMVHPTIIHSPPLPLSCFYRVN